MKKLIITNNGSMFNGSVILSGAKNSALKVLIASTLAIEEVIIDNIPLGQKDVKIELKMLESLGAIIKESYPGRVYINWPNDGPHSYVSDKFGAVRTNLLFLGALSSRTGKASVPFPGGCKIGERKFDLHINALQKLGIFCWEESSFLKAKVNNQITGTKIEFPIRTTGGTENTILAAVCAKGKTSIYNAHTRPEIIDLVSFLNKIGANISVLGSGLIELNGVEFLTGGYHKIIYDNMEALSFAAFSIITQGKILIHNFPEKDLEIPIVHLRESGANFTQTAQGMIIERPGILCPFDLSTGAYPGINSDMQPLFVVMATQAEGISRITDIRFKKRFQYIPELKKMGADISVVGNTVIVKGPTQLKGAKVRATDLRGGAALIAASLIADGKTIIEKADQIDRGYENIEKKLYALGVDILSI